MPNKKISELTAATTPAETDVMPIVQSATTKQATVSAWVRGALLTGLSTATNAAIAATDSVLVALGKLQAQITGHVGNTTNAHGMTTPGAAIVQAATVDAQRAALGLANHQIIAVDTSGNTSLSAALSVGATPGVDGRIVIVRDAYALGGNQSFGGILCSSSPGTDYLIGKYSDGGVGKLQVRTSGGVHLLTITEVGDVFVAGVVNAPKGVSLPDCASDSAAATAGVPVGGLYRTGTTPKIRAS